MSTDQSDRKNIKRALISVYDKTGLDDLARALDAAGVESSPLAPPQQPSRAWASTSRPWKRSPDSPNAWKAA